jgi:hypothetical protein
MTQLTTPERKLLDRAITTLWCALAHDEAVLHSKDITELAELRQQWVPQAEAIVEDAEELLGWSDGGLDDDEDDDCDEDELDNAEDEYRE